MEHWWGFIRHGRVLGEKIWYRGHLRVVGREIQKKEHKKKEHVVRWIPPMTPKKKYGAFSTEGISN